MGNRTVPHSRRTQDKIKIVCHPSYQKVLLVLPKKERWCFILSTSSQILHLLLSVIFHLYNLSLQFKILFIIFDSFVVSKLVLYIVVQSCVYKKGNAPLTSFEISLVLPRSANDCNWLEFLKTILKAVAFLWP